MSRAFPEPGPQDCLGALHPQALRGFRLFNERKYWEAHEALEHAWLEEMGEVRHLYRGILQIGVAYLHILRGNYPGTVKVYQRSKRWLEPFPNLCRGVNVGQLRQDADNVMVEVFKLGPEGIAAIDLQLLKPLQWKEIKK